MVPRVRDVQKIRRVECKPLRISKGCIREISVREARLRSSYGKLFRKFLVILLLELRNAILTVMIPCNVITTIRLFPESEMAS